jgi:hypothetical protein
MQIIREISWTIFSVAAAYVAAYYAANIVWELLVK